MGANAQRGRIDIRLFQQPNAASEESIAGYNGSSTPFAGISVEKVFGGRNYWGAGNTE